MTKSGEEGEKGNNGGDDGNNMEINCAKVKQFS